MTQEKRMMINLLCVSGLSALVTFSSIAMQETKKSLSLQDINWDAPKKTDEGRAIFYSNRKKFVENRQLIEEKEAQKKAKEEKLVEAKAQIIDKRYSELNKKFAEADEFQLKIVTISKKKQDFLNNLLYDQGFFDEIAFAEKVNSGDIDHSDVVFSNSEKISKRKYEKKICEETDPAKQLLFYIQNKQVVKVNDLILNEKNEKTFTEQPLVVYLKDIRNDTCSDLAKCGSVTQGNLEYTSYYLAKQKPNTTFLHNYHQNFILKRMYKEVKTHKLDKNSVHKQRCKGWELSCNGQNCNHVIEFDGNTYERNLSVDLSGEDVLNKKTILTLKAVELKNNETMKSIDLQSKYQLRTFIPTHTTYFNKPNAKPLVSINRYAHEKDDVSKIGHKSLYFISLK